MHALGAVALLVALMLSVVVRPAGAFVGWASAAAGLIALALGLVRASDAAQVASLTWDATLAFLGIVVIAGVLDELGLFRWAALETARRSGGRGRALFVATVLLGASVAALFANDGAALILTPILYEQARALDLEPAHVLAFVFAAGVVADTTSLPLVLSNLVNILAADAFRLGFLSYAARMVPVDLAAVAATVAALLALYGRSLPARVPVDHLPAPATALRDVVLARRAVGVMAFLAIGYAASEPLGLPISAVTTVGAAALLALARLSPAVSARRVVAEAPWPVVVFSLATYLLVFALRRAGLTHGVTDLVRAAAAHGLAPAVFATGLAVAALSSGLNNLPALLVGALAVQDARLPAPMTHALAYAAVVGADLGTKFSPVGSLATLLWLSVLERRGLRIGWGYFVRMGTAVALPVLLTALGALAASFALVR